MRMVKAKVRPKKPPRHDELVMIRFTTPQFRSLVRAARRAGVSVAVMCRTLIVSAVNRGVESRLRGNVLPAHSGAVGQENDGSPLQGTGS